MIVTPTHDADFNSRPDADTEMLNKDGTSKVLYHQGENRYTVFDTKHEGAGRSDYETPFGVYMKPTAEDIGLRGKNQRALYARIQNPLHVADREALVDYLLQDKEYARLHARMQEIDKEYSERSDKADKAYRNALFEWRKDNPGRPRTEAMNDADFKAAYDLSHKVLDDWQEATKKASKEAKERIGDYLKEKGFDGIILDRDQGSFGRSISTYIALDNTQVKSATENIGTFDSSNPDIRFQTWDDTADDTAAERNGRELAYARLQSENAILNETVAAIQKLNAKQEKTIEALQKRLSLTKTPETRRSDARKLARQLLKENNSRAELDAVAEEIKALGDYLLQTPTEAFSEEEFKTKARSAARTILESARDYDADAATERPA